MKTPREFAGKFSDDNAAGLPDSDLDLLAEMVDLRDCEHAAEFATLRRRLEEVERERDALRDGAQLVINHRDRLLATAGEVADVVTAERAARERAEAALGDAVYHLRNLLAVVKGELGGLADCCDVNNAESLLDRLSPQPTPTKEPVK